MYFLSVILLLATLLVVAVNLFISFYIRRDVQMALRLAERRNEFLREEQERLTLLHEERQTLIEELKQSRQNEGNPLSNNDEAGVLEELNKLQESLPED